MWAEAFKGTSTQGGASSTYRGTGTHANFMQLSSACTGVTMAKRPSHKSGRPQFELHLCPELTRSQ